MHRFKALAQILSQTSPLSSPTFILPWRSFVTAAPHELQTLTTKIIQMMEDSGVSPSVVNNVKEELQLATSNGLPTVDSDSALRPYFADIPETSKDLVAGAITMASQLLSKHLNAPLEAPGHTAWVPPPVTTRRIGQTETPVPITERVPSPSYGDYETDVLIVGAAAAGLSSGACLKQQGITCILLDQDTKVGGVWENRYHRLHLHDIIDNCHLPHLPMPDTYPVYPSRMQFAKYLQSYQQMMGLDVRLGCKVVGAAKGSDGRWQVKVHNLERDGMATYRSQVLIVANGMFTKPHVPEIPGQEQFQGQILHSSQFSTGALFRGKRVLVVGMGNSGAEIVCDLWEQGAKPTILQRSPSPIIPRWLVGVTQQVLYRSPFQEALQQHPDIFWKVADELHQWLIRREMGDVEAHGLRISPHPPIKGWRDMFRAACMDVGTVQLVRSGQVPVVNEEIGRFTANGVILKGSEVEYPFDAVVFATGFHVAGAHNDWLAPEFTAQLGSGWDFIQEEKVGAGAMAHIAGGPCPVPDLYFMWGNLQMIRDSAPPLALRIKERLHHA